MPQVHPSLKKKKKNLNKNHLSKFHVKAGKTCPKKAGNEPLSKKEMNINSYVTQMHRLGKFETHRQTYPTALHLF